jgi:hypothetical protein
MKGQAVKIAAIAVTAGVSLIVPLGAARAGMKDCAAIRAFNNKQPSRAAMKILPCHCIPISGRIDRVYRKPPPGMICGNGTFYDKQCHQGLSCGPELKATP